MKDLYAEKILKDDGLFRSLFQVVWKKRENEEPEEFHPDYDEIRAAMERVINSTSNDISADLWNIVQCFAETYYLIGLREGANMINTLLPVTNVQTESFGGNNASDVEINHLQILLHRLVELDPSKQDFVYKIEEKTSQYTHLTKKACRSLIEIIMSMIDNYESALSEIEKATEEA